MNKLIIIFILILVIIAVLFGFWHLTTRNFSKEVLVLEIAGPKTATMGDEITYAVTYQNSGNFVLQFLKLTFDLPENSLTEDSQMRVSQNLPDIYPGDKQVVQFKARLLGKQGDAKVARAMLSYVPKNLSVRYESNATFSTVVGAVGMTLDFNLPSSIKKGQEITYDIRYFSDIDYPLENVSMKVEPVNGFLIESAVPSSLDNIEWKLDVLQKGDSGKIIIKGLVSSDAGDALHFSARLGMWQDGVFAVIKDVGQDVASGGH